MKKLSPTANASNIGSPPGRRAAGAPSVRSAATTRQLYAAPLNHGALPAASDTLRIAKNAGCGVALDIFTTSEPDLRWRRGWPDVGGFYSKLGEFLDHQVSQGFVRSRHRAMLQLGESPHELLQLLRDWQPGAAPKWVEREPDFGG